MPSRKWIAENHSAAGTETSTIKAIPAALSHESYLEPGRAAALVRRIATSEPLTHAPRARELFEYLCRHALQNPGVPLAEHQIGIEVFGREPGYSNDDTIVRAQISQLRKRLQLYFSGPGEHEPIVIEIPVGSYIPRFLPRQTIAVVPKTLPQIPSADVSRHWSWPRSPNWAAAAALFLGLVLGWTLTTLHHTTLISQRAIGAPHPFLLAFWHQFFSNGEPANIVPADANALIVADLAGHSIGIEDYSDPQYPARLVSPALRSASDGGHVASDLRMNVMPISQLFLLERLTALLREQGNRFETVAARGLDGRIATQRNLILMGHSRAIPGEAPFNQFLNFQYRWDDATRNYMIVNTHPQAGELPSYAPVNRGTRYAVAALVRRPASQANILLLFGPTLDSTEGAIELVTDESEMAHLYQVLHLDLKAALPTFELLLACVPGDSHYEIVSYRSPAGASR